MPLRLGGGPSPVEAIYKHLKACVGDGFSGDDGTIEAYWRWARARAMWAACDDERAAMQAFPERATDTIPMYEDILGLQPAGRDDESRRQEIVNIWYAAAYGDHDTLEAALLAIDSRFDTLVQVEAYGATTGAGRAFEDYIPTTNPPPFGGGRSETKVPNFSHRLRFYARLDIGAGIPSSTDRNSIARAKAMLDKRLPAWVDHRVITHIGFFVGVDAVEYGGVGI